MITPSIVQGKDTALAVSEQPLSAEKLQLLAESCTKGITMLQIVIRSFPENRRNRYYYWLIGELCDRRARYEVELRQMHEREVAA
jgi:hypothetical protein